jgi:hypothetical protein
MTSPNVDTLVSLAGGLEGGMASKTSNSPASMASKNSSSSSSSSSETSLLVNAAIVGRLLTDMLSLGNSKVGLEVSTVASTSSASLSSVILGVLLVLLSSASLKARFVLFLLSSLSPILVSSSSCS